MGLFSFTQELAMDLGTANTIITCNDKMVVDEPSVIALDARSEKVLAVGRQAREMYEKTNPNIRTIRPLREGVIADFYAAEQMMRGLIKMASGRKRWFAPSLRMVIGIPSVVRKWKSVPSATLPNMPVAVRYICFRTDGSRYRGRHGCACSGRKHDCRHRWRYDRDRGDFVGGDRFQQVYQDGGRRLDE